MKFWDPNLYTLDGKPVLILLGSAAPSPSIQACSFPGSWGEWNFSNEQMGHGSVVNEKSGKHTCTGNHQRMFGERIFLTAVSEYLQDEPFVSEPEVHTVFERGAFSKK